MNIQTQKPTREKPSAPAAAEGLVRAEKLLAIIVPDESQRPSLRWLEEQRKKRRIPFVKMGSMVYFDPVQVRRALDSQRNASFGLS